ncbi:MAG TPA: hypothetical protein VJZ71_17710 [Phycisphaerae bacterium]|nr:hypothetical protein [Phycisphaerae bacterium]
MKANKSTRSSRESPFFVSIEEVKTSFTKARPLRCGALYLKDRGSGYSITPSGLTLLDSLEQIAKAPEKLTRREREKLKLAIATVVMKSLLKDDDLISTYVKEGSYRKAAASLSDDHKKVSKDAVMRAVRRKGGPAAVRSEYNSASVRRTIASQQRDKRKRFSTPSQSQDSE